MAKTQVINLNEMREFKRAERYFEAKILNSILADDLGNGMHYGKVLAALRGSHAKYLAGEIPKNQGQRGNYVFEDAIVISPKIDDSLVARFLDLLFSVALAGTLPILDPSDFYSI